ncbi:MAG: WG repeat-containing protein [Candidatus Obscuribacterales bacterium]|nr:WG repeat-containing protein [Candidatus Obscuribacterales bacterium]
MFVKKLRNVAVTSLACILSTASYAADDWKLVDSKNVVSEIPKHELPPWKGWTDGLAPNGRKARKKKEPDGSELIYYIGDAADSDRFPITRTNASGRFENHGFVDTQGSIVVKPEYICVQEFHNDLAAIELTRGSPWLLIDKAGAVKYQLPADMHPEINNGFKGVAKNGISIVMREFSEDLSAVDSVSPMSFGFVDKQGKFVIAKQYNHASDFSEGLSAVLKDNHWKFIDRTGKTVITLPEDCSFANSFSEGLASVALGGENKVPPYLCARKGAKWGFVDKTGKLVITPTFYVDGASGHDVPMNRPQFKEGLAHVAVGDELQHKYGFIDKTGKWKIKPQFKNAEEFSNGKAKVCFGETGFSKEDWNNAKSERGLYRYSDFRLFAKQYGLISMSRSAVNEILGKPDKWYWDSDVYHLTQGSCGESYRGVEIHYDWSKVNRFRILEYGREGPWQSDISVLEKNLYHI